MTPTGTVAWTGRASHRPGDGHISKPPKGQRETFHGWKPSVCLYSLAVFVKMSVKERGWL